MPQQVDSPQQPAWPLSPRISLSSPLSLRIALSPRLSLRLSLSRSSNSNPLSTPMASSCCIAKAL